MTDQAQQNRQSDVGLYGSSNDALKKVCSEYEYWSGRLTETSLQMCCALIAANWPSSRNRAWVYSKDRVWGHLGVDFGPLDGKNLQSCVKYLRDMPFLRDVPN